MTPQDVTPGSTRTVWWRCPAEGCEHRWQTTVANRASGSRCPECRRYPKPAPGQSLAYWHPELLVEWDDARNQMTPQDVTLRSQRKVWWRCSTCDHRWRAVVANRTLGRGCPACAGKTATTTNNLAVRRPDVAAEWDHERNEKAPEDVTHGTTHIAWWRCSAQDCGYRWQAAVHNRTRGAGCPACAWGLDATAENLAVMHPEHVEDWDNERNGLTQPAEILRGSQRRIWWRCSACDHRWRATTKQKVGYGCPRCAYRRRLTRQTQTGSPTTSRLPGAAPHGDGEYMEHSTRKPDITETHPRIAADWDHERNGTGPTDVTHGSRIRVWWRCSVQDCGHRWQTTVANRARGSGCPECRRKPAPGQSVADRHPELIVEWDDERNPMTAQDVTHGSHKKVWWRCPASDCGHRWRALVSNRTRGAGCPACAGKTATATNNLAVRRPDLAAQWDHEANGELKPEDVTPGSSKKAWWRCPVPDCGHRWQTAVSSKTKGTTCPECRRRRKLAFGRCLADKHPEIAAQWDDERNSMTPEDVTAGSRTKAWWRCPAEGCGHRWLATVNDRTRGSGCPACAWGMDAAAENLAVMHPEHVEEWDDERNGLTQPGDILGRSQRRIWWRCSTCDYRWRATAKRKIGYGCPACAQRQQETDPTPR